MRFAELRQREPGRDELDTRSGARVIVDALSGLKWQPDKRERTGVRYSKRVPKKRRDNFLSLLLHTQMRDWNIEGHGLDRRNERKAERQRRRVAASRSPEASS